MKLRILFLGLLFLLAAPTGEKAAGKLKVKIVPPDAVSAGAKWRMDDETAWRDSGTTARGLSAGERTVYFNKIDGWKAPKKKTVNIVAGETAKIRGKYKQLNTDVPPTAAFEVDDPIGKAPVTIQFDDASTSEPPVTAWAWDFGDGNTSTEQDPTHAYTQPGIYTVSLTVTSPSGSDTITRSDYIAVGGEPVLSPEAVVPESLPGIHFASQGDDQLEFTVDPGTDTNAIQVGSILAGDGDGTGYLRRVTGVNKSGSQIVISTEPATLGDLFEHCVIEGTATFTPADLGLGEKAGFINFGPITLTGDVSGSIDAGINMIPSIDYDLYIDDDFAPHFRLGMSATLAAHLSAQLAASAGASFKDEVSVYERFGVPKPTIPWKIVVPVGGVPVPIHTEFEYDARIGWEGSCTGEFAATGGYAITTEPISIEVEYDGVAWSETHNFTVAPQITTLNDLAWRGELSSKFYYRPEVSWRILYVLGPSLGIGAVGNLKISRDNLKATGAVNGLIEGNAKFDLINLERFGLNFAAGFEGTIPGPEYVVFRRSLFKPMVKYLELNGGAATTGSPNVTLHNLAVQSVETEYFSSPVERLDDISTYIRFYKAGESNDMPGAAWLPYEFDPELQLTLPAGQKSVFFKVEDSAGQESEVASDTIQLTDPPAHLKLSQTVANLTTQQPSIVVRIEPLETTPHLPLRWSASSGDNRITIWPNASDGTGGDITTTTIYASDSNAAFDTAVTFTNTDDVTDTKLVSVTVNAASDFPGWWREQDNGRCDSVIDEVVDLEFRPDGSVYCPTYEQNGLYYDITWTLYNDVLIVSSYRQQSQTNWVGATTSGAYIPGTSTVYATYSASSTEWGQFTGCTTYTRISKKTPRQSSHSTDRQDTPIN